MYGTIQEWEISAHLLGQKVSPDSGHIVEVTFSTEIGLITLDIPPSQGLTEEMMDEVDLWNLSIKGSHVTFEPDDS